LLLKRAYGWFAAHTNSMSFNKVGEIFSSHVPVWKAAVVAGAIDLSLLPRIKRPPANGQDGKSVDTMRVQLLVFALAWIWLSFVSAYAPEPYLVSALLFALYLQDI
jgi:hypothetical protein